MEWNALALALYDMLHWMCFPFSWILTKTMNRLQINHHKNNKWMKSFKKKKATIQMCATFNNLTLNLTKISCTYNYYILEIQ